MSFRKLKLIGDGTGLNTELIDTETGENILQNYAFANVRIELNGGTLVAPKITLELHPAGVDVELKFPSASENLLDIAYPGLAKAFHLDNTGIEEAPAAEKPVQS